MHSHDEADCSTPAEFPTEVPTETLGVHRAGPDGAPGEQIAVARAVTPTAAVMGPEGPLDPDVDVLAQRPDTPELPLVLVDAHGRSIPVFAVHESDRASTIALEIEEPLLSVLEEDPDGSRTMPGRSVWCQIFPRMRGC